MNITLTFTGADRADIPDGTTLTIEDVDDFQVSTPAGIEVIDCATACCDGCATVHRRLTGAGGLTLEASGRNRALWKIPEATR
jgi:hypothetical protein